MMSWLKNLFTKKRSPVNYVLTAETGVYERGMV